MTRGVGNFIFADLRASKSLAHLYNFRTGLNLHVHVDIPPCPSFLASGQGRENCAAVHAGHMLGTGGFSGFLKLYIIKLPFSLISLKVCFTLKKVFISDIQFLNKRTSALLEFFNIFTF